MGMMDWLLEKRDTRLIEQVTTKVVDSLETNLSKAASSTMVGGTGLKRYQFDPSVVNGGQQNKMKPGAGISFQALRRFSTQHDISRACINVRKRQIAGLEWDIVTAEHDDVSVNDTKVQELKAFFKDIGGNGNNYRKFTNKLIEDLLVLDAVALYKQKTVGGKLYTLLPIDAATIRLRVDESGALPLPPEAAYVQWIRGQKTAEMTSDEMVYDMMNPRNDTPYGLAPLESMIITVSSALKAGTYNLAYLTDGNIPEGIFNVPENWTPQMIAEFQQNWDAAMAGDEMATSKLKFVPGGGGGYVPTKKATDMAWEQFNEWLMKVTCAMFEVQPIEIGFPPKGGLGGKGFSEGQDATTMRKGIMPLAAFIEEIFTKIIQIDFGYTDLRFEFIGLQQKDAKATAETNEILIRSGQRTVDELRSDDGLDPIGVDKPFVIGQPTFIDEESLQQKADAAAAIQEQPTTVVEPPKEEPPVEDTKKYNAEESHIELVTEIRKFRKMALGRIKKGKQYRSFESDVLPEEVVADLNLKLEACTDAELAKGIFNEFMQDYQINFLANVTELKKGLSKILS